MLKTGILQYIRIRFSDEKLKKKKKPKNLLLAPLDIWAGCPSLEYAPQCQAQPRPAPLPFDGAWPLCPSSFQGLR